jgi:hypothetical protein
MSLDNPKKRSRQHGQQAYRAAFIFSIAGADFIP